MKTLLVSLILTLTVFATQSSAEPIFRKARYTGLLGDEGVSDPTKRGLINAVTNPNRNITAKVKRKGRSISFKGRLDITGRLNKDYNITVAGQVIATFHVDLQFAEDGNSMAGIIEEGGEVQTFNLTRAIFSAEEPTALAGNFTALIPPAGGNFPTGTGFASVKITPLGAVTITGKLADGAAFISKTPVVLDNKIVVFNLLYQNNGAFVGVLSFGSSTDQATGQITWARLDSATPDKIVPSAYQGGVTMNLNRYTKPAAGTAALPNLNTAGDARLVLQDGNLVSPFIADVTVNAKSKVIVPAPNDAGLSIKIDPLTGLVNGTANVTLTDREKKVSFFGVISQAAADQGVRGYFIGKDKAGPFTLQALP
jgi:hypothetical protein